VSLFRTCRGDSRHDDTGAEARPVIGGPRVRAQVREASRRAATLARSMLLADVRSVGRPMLAGLDPSVRPDPDQARLVDRVETLELQLRIAEAIHTGPELEGARVRVRLADDVVTLEGTVVTTGQKARAEQIARTFERVRRVENELIVAASDTGRRES